MKTITVIAIAVLIAGCNTRGFVKEGTSYQDFYRDLKQCEVENTPKWAFCVGHVCNQQQSHIKKRRNQCMQARGWELSRDDNAFRP